MALKIDRGFDRRAWYDDISPLCEPSDLTWDDISPVERIPDDLISCMVASPLLIRFTEADAVMSRTDPDPGSDIGSDTHSLENSALYDRSPTR